MRRFGKISAPVLTASLLIGTPAIAQSSLMDLLGIDAPKGEELEALIEEAQQHPLGSENNPVRANMPRGQRAYLNRLRCADGKAPTYDRVGSMGVGIYGQIIDGYEVICEDSETAKSMIIMDMYHPEHVEVAPVPGFTIEAAREPT
jgi:hypothetical protein